MRASTLVQWGAIALVFIITILAVQGIGGFVVSGGSGFSDLRTETPAGTAACSGLGYGGFYQDYLSSPQSFERRIGEWTFTINPVFKYTVVGKVIGKDEYPLVAADALAPMDLAIANGDILSPDLFSRFTFSKTPRHYHYQYYFPAGTRQLSSSYISEHISNNHMIFANDAVYTTAKTVMVGDFIRMTGYLTTVNGKTPDGRTYFQGTSTTRTDTGEGACEVMYVESIEKFSC